MVPCTVGGDESHEANPSPAPGALSHACPGFPLLLLRETAPEGLGTEIIPLELMYKYGNLSEGVCKPGYAAAKMTTIYPMFAKPAPMFLDPNFRRFSKISNFFPPFGIKTQEKIIDNILTATKSYGLGEELDSQSCKKCIIMGNGGILANKSMGVKIDEYDVIARLNEAPVSGYEKDVGSKTTMRITYPEGAIQKTERYEQDSLFVLSAFKALDFKWLRSIIFKERLRSTEGFWKSVARHVPREPSEMRILNPYFIQEAAFRFIGLPHNNGQMGRGVRVPSPVPPVPAPRTRPTVRLGSPERPATVPSPERPATVPSPERPATVPSPERPATVHRPEPQTMGHSPEPQTTGYSPEPQTTGHSPEPQTMVPSPGSPVTVPSPEHPAMIHAARVPSQGPTARICSPEPPTMIHGSVLQERTQSRHRG
ncbi:CMP-N-acetylneuraminate-beta-1,4-galactoside alpha-2,3-sialyltransferase-like isoform X2 [Oncorhynchus keta]|uniref:CMP-N-acetylneuraminate-beta-1,4-galactoside alpha-2,3-sialyltransferase-like isoform X2 n=1 Tax=Oncorhynchus keta TaxID=8018 RepID=UPI00227ADF5B|nr:CMP-N-acetylneuraminate-beta-1,4-galactoside alpha-2,3-sialyltransferase-like isoform X2 [Oncorhynchus keta]XP_052317117.1 CMP-N-acetylneuraminate-beta-1,4-galactoside alpha-2,3-sialyltransferase-like isoform X2 [Oncorhynchus keta]